MTVVDSTPLAVHLGADDLPFVDIGGGNELLLRALCGAEFRPAERPRRLNRLNLT
jgi:hypothetical protein